MTLPKRQRKKKKKPVSHFERCQPASSSQEGLNIFLTRGNVTINFFEFKPRSRAVHYTFLLVAIFWIHKCFSIFLWASSNAVDVRLALLARPQRMIIRFPPPFSRRTGLLIHCHSTQPAARYLVPERNVSNPHSFLPEAHHSLLALGNTWQNSSTTFWAPF